jgi:hypothetical protein
MRQKLVITLSYLLLICRWTGLTSYSVKKNLLNGNFTFEKTKFSKFINVVYVIVNVLVSLTVGGCNFEQNGIDSITSNLSVIVFANSFLLFMFTMNFKQTRVVKTFCKIISLEGMVERLVHKEMNLSRISNLLIYYESVRYINVLLMVVLHSWLLNFFGVPLMICLLRYFFVTVVTITGEGLIFYYLQIISTSIAHLNDYLKTFQTIYIKDLKKIFQSYIELKKDIQSITQQFIYSKLTYILIEFTAKLSNLWNRSQDDNLPFHFKFYLSALAIHSLLSLLLEIFLLLYPLIRFYREVRQYKFLFLYQ